MNNVGIAIRSSKGEFKDFDEVLNEFVNKYKKGTMSQVDFLAGINTLGGSRQKETILSLVENFDQVKKHQDDLTKATGSAKQMYDVYSQSLEARISDLKRAFEGLYEKIMSSDSLKWLVSEATNLITALSNLDGKSITYIATIGTLSLALSKLVKINKELMLLTTEGGIVTGLTKFIGLASGMVSLENGATGVATAFGVLGTSIKGATASAMGFIATPIGLAITSITAVIGVAIYGFVSYQQHQAELTEQSKSLKSALDGVNNSLKGGDTTKAQEEANKMKSAQEKLQQYIELRKKAQDTDSKSLNPTASGTNQTSVIEGFNQKIKEQIKVLTDAGYTVEETTGKIKEFTDAQDKIYNTKIINSIKEQTKSQLEHRENLDKVQAEYNNYISTVKNLYTEYQNLSAQENLSAEQKTKLQGTVEQLQGKMSGLNVSIDENGKVLISNSPLIEANIQKLISEGLTVDNLSAIRITDSKVNSQWQVGNSQVTYNEITNRIEMYKAEIKAIQSVIQARMAGASDYSTMSIGKAQSLEAGSPEFDKLKEETDQLHAYEKAKKEADDLYAGIGSVAYSAPSGGGVQTPSNGDYMPSGGDSSEKKKAEKELEDSEKKMLSNITDAYKQAKDTISNNIEEIDAKITGLGDIDDSNFTQKVSLVNDKIGEQKQIVEKAQEQLDSLKNTTVTTADAQKELESATLSASKELRQESLEVAKLQSEIEKTDIDELKKMYEDQQKIETETLEANQKAQTDKIESIKKAQEDAHNEIMDDYEDELDALDKKSKKLDEDNDKIDRANELEKEKNDLTEKQKELNNVKSQLTNQVYQKQADGTWQFEYVADTQKIAEKQKEVTEAQKTLDDTNRKNSLDDAKKEIEDKKSVIEADKKAEDEAYTKKKAYLDEYSSYLKESQERDTKRLENHYSDIEKMAKDTLKKLEEEHNNDWNAISDSISATLTRTKKALEDLTTLRANFTTSEANDAINSGDVSGYLTKNKDKMNLKASVDESDIDSHLNSISDKADKANNSVTILNKTYDELLSKKSINITEADINNKKVQVQKQVDIDNEGLTTTLNNLKAINLAIETEIDSHYSKVIDKQTQAQQNEMTSLQNFAKEYTIYYNKFLELVQTVNDFRFNNIVVNVQASVDNVLQGLEVIAKAYEKYAKAYNKMHPDDTISSSIDISDVQSANTSYKKSVSDYQANVLSSYSAEAFEKYASQIGSGIGDSLLSKLNNYSSSTSNINNTNNASTTNNSNKSTTSNTTNVNINQLDVNTKDAQNLLNQLLTIVKNKTNLS